MKKIGMILGLGILALILNFIPQQVLAQEAVVEIRNFKWAKCLTCRGTIDAEEFKNEILEEEDSFRDEEEDGFADSEESDRNIWMLETDDGQFLIEGRNIKIREIADGKIISLH